MLRNMLISAALCLWSKNQREAFMILSFSFLFQDRNQGRIRIMVSFQRPITNNQLPASKYSVFSTHKQGRSFSVINDGRSPRKTRPFAEIRGKTPCRAVLKWVGFPRESSRSGMNVSGPWPSLITKHFTRPKCGFLSANLAV